MSSLPFSAYSLNRFGDFFIIFYPSIKFFDINHDIVNERNNKID